MPLVVAQRMLILLSYAILVGCVGYTPAPREPAELSQRLAAKTIDPQAVRHVLSTLAPDTTWDGQGLDRLTLLAAALALSPELARARANADAAAAETRAAAVAPGPTLTLTTEYAFNAPESSPWLFGIAGDVPLDTGARRESRIEIAQLARRIAVFDYMDSVWALRQRIRQALAEHLLSLQEVVLGRALTEVDARELSTMEHRLALGAASLTDVARVRSRAEANRRRLADADARAGLAAMQLAAALGVPAGALDPARLRWPDVDSPQKLEMPLPRSCRDSALVGRSTVARASLSYEQAEATLKNAVASQYPSVQIGPGYTWERGLRKVPFSLGLALPARDLNHAAIAAAEARREEAGLALEATVANAYATIEQAQGDYRAAWEQYHHAERQNRIAQRIAESADRQIAAGSIDRVDWSTAQSEGLLASLDRLAAAKAVRQAEGALEDALRRPLDGPELAIGEPTSNGEFKCQPAKS